jgi:hypothetical protein
MMPFELLLIALLALTTARLLRGAPVPAPVPAGGDRLRPRDISQEDHSDRED